MEFNANRGGRQPQTTTNTPGTTTDAPGTQVGASQKPTGGKRSVPTLNMKLTSIALLFSATILIVALLSYLVIGAPKSEKSFVDTTKFQAVFLNGGQVYFGKIIDLNSKNLQLEDIYYLRVNQQVQPSEEGQAPVTGDGDISLVKLGCELHGPEDEMLINREQIIFWENLKDDGQVAKAVAEYKTENPEGQDCEQPQEAGADATAPTGSESFDDTSGATPPSEENPLTP
ncbi:hypothetical protein BH23PAT2_BH23PAT2_04710 [soil metagenome]